jgi:hypothetical protein
LVHVNFLNFFKFNFLNLIFFFNLVHEFSTTVNKSVKKLTEKINNNLNAKKSSDVIVQKELEKIKHLDQANSNKSSESNNSQDDIKKHSSETNLINKNENKNEFEKKESEENKNVIENKLIEENKNKA